MAQPAKPATKQTNVITPRNFRLAMILSHDERERTAVERLLPQQELNADEKLRSREEATLWERTGYRCVY
jgi:hypothetical protein